MAKVSLYRNRQCHNIDRTKGRQTAARPPGNDAIQIVQELVCANRLNSSNAYTLHKFTHLPRKCSSCCLTSTPILQHASHELPADESCMQTFRMQVNSEVMDAAPVTMHKLSKKSYFTENFYALF